MSTNDEINNDLLPNAAAGGGDDDAIWNAGRAESKKTNPVGTFQVIIKEAKLGRSTSSNRLQISYELEVASGDAVGAVLRKYDGLGTPKQASITQQQLTRIGIDLDGVSMATLPAVLADLTGRVIAVQAKQNGDFYNIYFTKAVDTAVGSSAPAGKPVDSPF